jgi:Big-like domain-containing protein
MKTKTLFALSVMGALCGLTPVLSHAQDIDSMAPVVVKTIPEAGTKDVSPGVMEIKVTFSKEMTDQSWSWSTAWKDSSPEGIGKPRYEANQRTCVLKVNLKPNTTYGYWINSQSFHGFKDKQGHAAVPYLLVFRTKAQ